MDAIDLSKFEFVARGFHESLNKRLRIQAEAWNPENDPAKTKTIEWVRLFVFRDSIRNLGAVFDMRSKFTIPPHEFDEEFVKSIFPETVFAALDYAGAQNAVFQIVHESLGVTGAIPICTAEFVPLAGIDQFREAIEQNVRKLNEIVASVTCPNPDALKWAKSFVFSNISHLYLFLDENGNARIPPNRFDPDVIRRLVDRFVPLAQKDESIEFTVNMLANEMGVKAGICFMCTEQATKGCSKCALRAWCSDECRDEDEGHVGMCVSQTERE